MGVAASILIIISVGAWWLIAPTSYEKTADRLYQMPLIQVDRSDGTDIYSQGMISLGQNNYNAAIRHFSEVEPGSRDYDNAQYYRAHALLLSGQYEEASLQFDLLKNTSDNLMRERAEWFSILAGIKQGISKDQVKTELQLLIQSPNHFYKDLAADLLKDF